MEHWSTGVARRRLARIGELDMPVQAKLLRCLEERVVVPLGAVHPIPVNVRLITATNRDLKAMVDSGEFREDLYYRINVVCLRVSPLRERTDDILPLARHFLSSSFALFEALSDGGWRGIARKVSASKTTKLEYV